METIHLPTHEGPRSYLLGKPSGYSGRLPLVIMLHGTGGSADLAARETGLFEFAQTHGFVVTFPDGLPVRPDLPPKFLTNPQRWNDGSAKPDSPLYSNSDDITFLERVVHDAIERTDADPHRVYLTGFSNGAGMTFRMASERAGLFAAIAPVAGYCWIDHPSPVRPIPTIYLIGDADPLLPLSGGMVKIPWSPVESYRPPIAETLGKWAIGLGCREHAEQLESNVDYRIKGFSPVAGTLRVPSVDHGTRSVPTTEFLWYVVHDLGHHWPGGLGQLNPRLGGPSHDRVDANELIWGFFQRHRLN